MIRKSQNGYDIIQGIVNNDYFVSDLSNDRYKFYYRIQNLNREPVQEFRRPSYVLSLIFLFLIVVSGFLIIEQQPRNVSEKLFKTYYSSENIIDITRSDEVNVAIVRFKDKDYAEASVLFSNIIKRDSTNIAVIFYNGICQIENNELENAIKSFQYIIRYEDTLYVEHAEWYLALCYLKTHQLDLAKVQFKKIVSEDDNYYKKDAQKILSELK